MENIAANDTGWVVVFLTTPVHILDNAIPIPSWRLLLRAGIERPQGLRGRNVSVRAEASAQVPAGCSAGKGCWPGAHWWGCLWPR